MNVTTPTQTTDAASRIYEFQAYGEPAASVITYETESLTVAATSGDLHRVALDAGYSGGQGTILEGNAMGDFVTYTVNVPEARTYDIRVRIKKLGNRGIWQFSSNGVNQGSPDFRHCQQSAGARGNFPPRGKGARQLNTD